MRTHLLSVCLSGRKRSIYDSDVAKDVIAYIRLASGVYAREDILRVVNKPMRFISREAYAASKADIKDALIFYRDRENILKQAERFAGDVEIMGRMSPRAALRYLMKVAGYESFLKSEGRSTRELYELYGIAGSYTSLKQWLKAIADSTFTDDNTDNAGNRERVVSVMTLHSSKGLEFDEVFIPDVNEGIIPCRRAVLTEDTEEERRLFYVGMTRAVKKLHIYYLNESCGKEMQPSVFLKPVL